MNQAQYEMKKTARTRRYELRERGRAGKEGYLAGKIAARRRYFAQKREATDSRFEGKKQARINMGMQKMDKKAASFSAKTARWNKGWDKMRAKWEARTRKFNRR